MSAVYEFDINPTTDVYENSLKIHYNMLNNIFRESSLVTNKELIGNRFPSSTEGNLIKIQKSKLERFEELGLLGAIEKSEITSTNYKEFIKKRR